MILKVSLTLSLLTRFSNDLRDKFLLSQLAYSQSHSPEINAKKLTPWIKAMLNNDIIAEIMIMITL